MTVIEIIHQFDSLKPNTYSQEQKVQWIDRLDCFLRANVFERFRMPLPDLTNLRSPDRALLLPEECQDVYLHWLESKIHYYNEELDRYNAAVRMFRGALEDWQRQLMKEAEPVNPGFFQI